MFVSQPRAAFFMSDPAKSLEVERRINIIAIRVGTVPPPPDQVKVVRLELDGPLEPAVDDL